MKSLFPHLSKLLQCFSIVLLVLLLAVSCGNEDNSDNNPAFNNPAISFETLINEPFMCTIQHESEGFTIDPTKFDIDAEIENGFLFKEPKVRIDVDTILIDLQTRGDWCECLIPDEVNIKIIATPKEGAFENEEFLTTITPVHIKLVKERTWFSRCLWLLLTIAGLLLLMFFLLRALIKKNRLKKEETTDNSDLYPNETEEQEGGRRTTTTRRRGKRKKR